jgi:hypothetical protein
MLRSLVSSFIAQSLVAIDPKHDLRAAAETAACQTGMPCLSVQGLAAFAAHCGKAAQSGSLQDQLAGLEVALDVMTQKRLKPQVLHLCNLDEELSLTNDKNCVMINRIDFGRGLIWGSLCRGIANFHLLQF